MGEYDAMGSSGPGAAHEDDEAASPRVVGLGDAEIATALTDGAVVAVPGVGGYCLAVRIATPGAEARLESLAADPDGPHYLVGNRDDVRALTSGWSVEIERLLERCWPGPVDVFLPRAMPGAVNEANGEGPGGGVDTGDEVARDDTANDSTVSGEVRAVSAPADADSGGWAVTVGMPDGRALRRLCKEHGPWRTIPLTFNEATEVAHAFDVTHVALVVDGGRRDGELPTLVDATVTPIRVLREGALPSNFIDASMAMGARRRWFSRRSKA